MPLPFADTRGVPPPPATPYRDPRLPLIAPRRCACRPGRASFRTTLLATFIAAPVVDAQVPTALEAIARERRSLDGVRASGDTAAIATAHHDLGVAFITGNQYDSAAAHLIIARDLRTAIGDRAGLGRSVNSLGAAHYQSGAYEPALYAFLQALALRREVDDRRGIALVLTNIGKVYHDWRQFERAHPILEEAATIATAVGDPVTLGYALHTQGVLRIDLGDFAGARELLLRSRDLYATANPSDSLSGWLLNTVVLGQLAVREGRPREAIPILQEVLATAERQVSARGQGRALLYLGQAYAALGRHADAIEALERSLTFSRRAEQRVISLEALEQLAKLEEGARNTAAALRHLRAYDALRDTIFDQSTAQRVASMEARAETEREQRENARLLAEQHAQRLVIARQRTVVVLASLLIALAGALLALLYQYNRAGRARAALLAQTNAELEHANDELRTALSEVRTLKGLIPICANCKRIRDDQGFWDSVESYISSRSEAIFSHGICTSCGPELYGKDWVGEGPSARAPER